MCDMASMSCCVIRLGSPDDLRPATRRLAAQLEQLKQEYEKKIGDLEQRIAALEKQDSQASVPAQAAPQQSASQVTASQLGKAVGEGVKAAIVGPTTQAQGQLPSEPSYNQLQEAQTKISELEREAKTFEFHGYFRSGYGLNSEGGQQVAFQAPGAGAKFRLGNELRPTAN